MATRDDPGTTAIIFPGTAKTWSMGVGSVGGLLPKTSEPLAAALIVCVNYSGSPTVRHQTQAWYGLYENNSIFIEKGVDVDSPSLRLIREENGDQAY